MHTTPTTLAGYRTWSGPLGAARCLFVGKGPKAEPLGTAAELLPAGVRPAWLQQVHGASVVPAKRGLCSTGDALVSLERELALLVVTADCVPVLLAGGGKIAAVHAGWRGIAAGVVGAALAALAPVGDVEAWIGPAIGPCCYEVGEEVADEVAAAAPGPVVGRGTGRLVLDLPAAVRAQLRERGVDRIGQLPLCTRCNRRWLWSYRRDGPAAGRNMAFIWTPA